MLIFFQFFLRGSIHRRLLHFLKKKKIKYLMDLTNFRGVFNASLHPKVQKGEMTEEQVFLEFMSNFADRNKDGKITREVKIFIFFIFF